MQKGLYLRITDGPHVFLLASEDVVSIERQDRLRPNLDPEAVVVAWPMDENKRQPVVRLSRLLGYEANDWHQAVFTGAPDDSAAIAAEQVHLLQEPFVLEVKPFNPIGLKTGEKFIYSGVCVTSDEPVLVLSGPGLIASIKSLMRQ